MPRRWRRGPREIIADAMAGCARRSALPVGRLHAARPTYRLLAAAETCAWECVEMFFGDERFVPPDHPDTNYRMVRESLLAPARSTRARCLPFPPTARRKAAAEPL